MKTKHNDAGLIYMKELWFRQAKTICGLFSDIDRYWGEQYAEDFFFFFQAGAEGNSNDDEMWTPCRCHILGMEHKICRTTTKAAKL